MTKGGTYASPPCMAGEVCPSYFDPLGVHPGQARDVARWRRAERTRLARLRQNLGQAAQTSRPQTIGIALTAARLPTIFPQPHGIPLDLILTEDGIAATGPDSRTHV
jgi:hypothetical protein